MKATALSNAELIAAYLDAVIRKDASVVHRYFDPDVEYMENGTPVPDPGGALAPISVEYHVRQFLNVFGIPAYFPPA